MRRAREEKLLAVAGDVDSPHDNPMTTWLRCVPRPVINLTSFFHNKGEGTLQAQTQEPCSRADTYQQAQSERDLTTQKVWHEQHIIRAAAATLEFSGTVLSAGQQHFGSIKKCARSNVGRDAWIG